MIVAKRDDLTYDYILYDDPVTLTLPTTFVSSGAVIVFTDAYEISTSEFESDTSRLLQDSNSILIDDGLGNLILGEVEITEFGEYVYYVRTKISYLETQFFYIYS